MSNQFILALDQSTSGSKAAVVNNQGQIISLCTKEHRQSYPKPGWVEHDPLEIYQNCKELLIEVVAKAGLQPSDLTVLAITNQRETIVLWDRETGQPVYNAIVWQCRRTADLCEQLKLDGMEEMIQARTGLQLDPYFSATKIKWILDNVSGVKEKAHAKQLCIGTIDSWLIWKFTKGAVHATDYTNASRTLLYNSQTLQWDLELLELFQVEPGMLPEVKSSNEIFGYTAKGELFADVSLPIAGVIGDSQGALFGQQCIKPGMVKATYGTGTSVLMHTGQQLVRSEKGLVSAIAWGINGQVDYAVEGIIHCSGDAVKWVKDNLGLFDSFAEAEALINSLPSNEGVYLVPAFVGLGIPYWQPNVRAAILGMSRGASKAHIIRAAVEAIAYQINDAINVMVEESGIALQELKADGGATSNQFLMQFQADLLQRPVNVAKIAELSMMGSVYLAGLAVEIWPDLQAITDIIEFGRVYQPQMDQETRQKNMVGWQQAVASVLKGVN